MLAPVSRCARLGDQLQLDDEANSKIAATEVHEWSAAVVTVLPSSVGDLPTSSLSAPQLIPEQAGSARTPPVQYTRRKLYGTGDYLLTRCTVDSESDSRKKKIYNLQTDHGKESQPVGRYARASVPCPTPYPVAYYPQLTSSRTQRTKQQIHNVDVNSSQRAHTPTCRTATSGPLGTRHAYHAYMRVLLHAY